MIWGFFLVLAGAIRLDHRTASPLDPPGFSFLEVGDTPGFGEVDRQCVACQYLIERTVADYHDINKYMLGATDPPLDSTGFPRDRTVVEVMEQMAAGTPSTIPELVTARAQTAPGSEPKVGDPRVGDPRVGETKVVSKTTTSGDTVTRDVTVERKEGEPGTTSREVLLETGEPEDESGRQALPETGGPEGEAGTQSGEVLLQTREPWIKWNKAQMAGLGRDLSDFIPKRDRAHELLVDRPSWERYSNILLPNTIDSRNLIARNQFQFLTQIAYKHFAQECSEHVPEILFPMCKRMAARFRVIANGIFFRDRPDQTCALLGFCTKQSYLWDKEMPHARLQPLEGDKRASIRLFGG